MILSAVLMIDWLNCTDGGTSDSLSSSDDRLSLFCAPEPDQKEV